MTNPIRLNASGLGQQSGAVVLLTVVLLLIMVTLVTLYTGKIQSFEHRIAINEQNQKYANVAAKSGLATSLAILATNKTWPSSTIKEDLPDASHYLAQANTQTLKGGRKLVSIKATGQSPDGLATSVLQTQAVIYPLLFNLPVAPLMVKAGLAQYQQFAIGFNPNGRGTALPLSIWTDAPIVLTSLHFSCDLSDFYSQTCHINPYSQAGDKRDDIADASGSFPSDIFSYLFNLPTKHWRYLNQLSDLELAECSALDIGSKGLIWVNGDCEISGNTQVASENQPIILIVFDGQLTLQSKALVYGLALVFKPASSTNTLDISMQSQAMVQGAVVANFKLGEHSGMVRVGYNAAVAAALQQNIHLLRVAKVPGSHHDF
ncbi:hypothetical protein [Paraglaciecola aestuariivivens]